MNSNWKQAEGNETFIYALNAKGTNEFWFNVSAGDTDEGERLSDEETLKIANLVVAAPKLLAALEESVYELEQGYKDQGAYGTLGYEEMLPRMNALIASAKGE